MLRSPSCGVIIPRDMVRGTLRDEGAMRARLATVAALVVAAVVLGACGGSEPATGPTGGAPPSAGVEEGRALYAASCARCHGADLNGTAVGPPLLHDFYRPGHHSDASFLLAVRRGVRAHHWDFGNMAPVPGLSDGDVEAIVEYVRSEQRAVGVE